EGNAADGEEADDDGDPGGGGGAQDEMQHRARFSGDRPETPARGVLGVSRLALAMHDRKLNDPQASQVEEGRQPTVCAIEERGDSANTPQPGDVEDAE